MSIHFLVACVLSFKLYIKKYFFGIHFLTHRNQNCIQFNKPCMTLLPISFTQQKLPQAENHFELKTTWSEWCAFQTRGSHGNLIRVLWSSFLHLKPFSLCESQWLTIQYLHGRNDHHRSYFLNVLWYVALESTLSVIVKRNVYHSPPLLAFLLCHPLYANGF